MHTITTRPPTPEEQRSIDRGAKPDLASSGCLILFFGVLPYFLFGRFGAWLGRHVSPREAERGLLIGRLAAVLLFVAMLGTFLSQERRRRKRAHKDLAEATIQEIAVTDARVIEIGAINDIEPIFVFDIGGGKLLYLQGQWLREESIYGAPRVDGDPDGRFLNGLDAPYSFPSTSFTVVRLPNTGRVLSIRPSGTYLPPIGNPVEALRKEYDFGQSSVFDGDLESISEVLAREYANTKND